MTIAPTKNCKVKLPNDVIGLVREVRPAASPENALIYFQDGTSRWVEIGNLKNGFSRNNYVVHQPLTATGKSLGFGKVLLVRTEMGLTQLLVCFAETGESRWLDWIVLGQGNSVEV